MFPKGALVIATDLTDVYAVLSIDAYVEVLNSGANIVLPFGWDDYYVSHKVVF